MLAAGKATFTRLIGAGAGAALDGASLPAAAAASTRSRSGFMMDVAAVSPPMSDAPPAGSPGVNRCGLAVVPAVAAALIRRRDDSDIRSPVTRPDTVLTNDVRRTMPRTRAHCRYSQRPASTTNVPTFSTPSATVTVHSIPVMASGGCSSADVTPTLYCSSAVETATSSPGWPSRRPLNKRTRPRLRVRPINMSITCMQHVFIFIQ